MKKILILANHFITLFSFRKELIKKLIEDGNEVYLSMPESEDNKYFTDMGCIIIPTEVDRRGMNPLKDYKLLQQYKKIMKDLKPDIIFSYTKKPNIYGAMASNKLGYRQVCNITGLGSLFDEKQFATKVCNFLYARSVKNSYKVFFQNNGDKDFFIRNKMIRDNYEVIPGSGCNVEQYEFKLLLEGEDVNFIFIGRVMKLKGIDEFLEAAKKIRAEYKNTHFYIAGWNEEEEYKRIVKEYEDAGAVEYIGFQKNISEWIEKCHCTILPSHGGEGVPNVLLESAAMGRVCIGSRIAGTEDVIDEGVNGYLFETGSADSLAEMIRKFLKLGPEERQKMGRAGREKIEREFNRQIVMDKYLEEVEKA